MKLDATDLFEGFGKKYDTPSAEPEEELSRVHQETAGYANPEDTEQEYPPGEQGDTLYQDPNEEEEDPVPEENMYGNSGRGIGEQLESILYEHPYNDFFKSMMDKEGLTGLKGLAPEKISAFFKKVAAEWRAKK
mgnify:CR=1 FL=1